MGQPAEPGLLAAYLCSPDSAFMLGRTLVIDGGYTIV
jgi:NAD(P)-dependent dehydrogenase (short-subunit alcohol dehydrogenase family)